MVRLGGICATAQAENSEVLFAGSVAVAVMNWFAATGDAGLKVKFVVHPALVVTGSEPMYVLPSPLLEASHAALAKNSRVKVVLGLCLKSRFVHN
jgi:hypothetical protein